MFCISGAAIAGATAGEPDLTVLAGVTLVAQCAPLAVRRRWPLAVWALAGTAAAIYGVADWPDPLVSVGGFLGLATVVECCSRRVAACAWLFTASVFVVVLVVSGDSDALDVWTSVVGLVLAPLLGDWQRARTAYLTEVRAGRERAEREHHREIRAAQLAERAHLARELHDVVAHHVSMIVVQAEAGAAADAAAGSSPSSSSASFDAIASAGRRALGELRTLLGVLRTDSPGPAPTAPQPGIDQVEFLVRAVTVPALRVELNVAGNAHPLPPAVDLSAYRVVQEGLTNVVKHSGATQAQVTIEYQPKHVRLQISDNGHGPRNGEFRAACDSSGRGLIGLHERVSVLGGTIHTGRTPNGGFQLDVVLPTEPA